MEWNIIKERPILLDDEDVMVLSDIIRRIKDTYEEEDITGFLYRAGVYDEAGEALDNIAWWSLHDLGLLTVGNERFAQILIDCRVDMTLLSEVGVEI